MTRQPIPTTLPPNPAALIQQGTLPTGTSQAQAQDLPNLPDQAQGPTTTRQLVPTTLPLNPTTTIQ